MKRSSISANSEYLIKLLRSILRDEPPPIPPNELSIAELYSLAESHCVSCMAYHALYKLNLAKQELGSFERAHRAYMTRSVMQEIEFAHISNAFETAGIDYLPLKGWFTRTLYPDAFMRSMGDIDILIHERDSKQVYSIMSNLGYTCKDFLRHDDDGYRKNGLLIEIHRALDADALCDFHYYDDPWRYAVCICGHRYELSAENGYLYTLAHIKKHFMNMGTGLRSVIDIYAYSVKLGKLMDRAYIEREAVKMGIAPFMKRMEKIANQLFGDEPMDDDAMEITRFLLECGSAGTQTNLEAVSFNRSGLGGKGGSKLTYGLQLAFPPYNAMKKRNPILKKAPVLLPLMYVWRWLQLLFVKRSRIKDAVERYGLIDAEYAERVRRIHTLAGIDR